MLVDPHTAAKNQHTRCVRFPPKKKKKLLAISAGTQKATHEMIVSQSAPRLVYWLMYRLLYRLACRLMYGLVYRLMYGEGWSGRGGIIMYRLLRLYHAASSSVAPMFHLRVAGSRVGWVRYGTTVKKSEGLLQNTYIPVYIYYIYK